MSENNENDNKKSPANTEIIDGDKNTQLHYYAAYGKVEEFKKTYSKKQKIDFENYLGWTPLMMACRNGHLEMVKTLLEHNADASRSNKFGYSVFLISVSSGMLDIVVLILQHLLCGGISKNSMQALLSPLSVSILFRHHDIFNYLITQNFDINAATPVTGLTPLMFAAAMEDNTSFTTLLDKNADVKIKNYVGSTAHDIDKNKRSADCSKTKSLTPAELIANSPHMTPFHPQTPQIVYSNGFVCLNPHVYYQHPRRCSNTPTPNIYFSPNVSPFAPFSPFVSQMFFPPEFSPQFYPVSPVPVPTFVDQNDLLNAKISDTNMNAYLSPNIMNYASPCM